MKATVAELTLKLSVLKDKIQKQEATIESLQNDLVQTNDDLDRLNAAHLEERAQLVHDLQSCEREIDRLQDVIIDKDKDISALTTSTAEYSEQIHELKREMKFKEDVLTKIEQDVQIFRDPQLSDQQFFNLLIPQLIEQLKRTETDLKVERKDGESKSNEIKDLIKQTEEDKKTIHDLRMETQKLIMNLKDQLLDREQVHDKVSFQEERNKLLAEVSKYKSELLMFSRKLEEQVECEEQLKQDIQDKSTIISSMEEKLKIVQEKTVAERDIFNKELKIRDEAKENLEKQLTDKIESIQSVNNNNQKLQESLEQTLGELARQKQHLDNAKEKMQAVQDQNYNLLLQEKDKCLHLQGSASELENTVSLLTSQIERLTSEITQLRETQTEKEQVTFAAQAQIQKLDELYKKLQEEYDLTKQELLKVISEKSLKEEEICKLVLEKEEICRNSSYQIQRIQDQLQHHKWESSKVEEEKTVEREKHHILESVALQGKGVSQEHWVQLHSHLQHCQQEIQQRDFSLQQLNIKLQQAIEEKEGVSSQLSTVSKMLRDSQQTVSELQNRCYWLQRQFQNQYSPTQASVYTEVPPGAPQEPISASFNPSGSDSGDLRMRLAEAEFHLSQLNSRLEEERSRREVAEEAMRLTEQRVKRYKREHPTQSYMSQHE
ncbi:hypothetical protein cypCar_00036361 [Cyprinus carpio]|nr:hypothetical protein cypCar_00036361 [Cyprinus carpio]